MRSAVLNYKHRYFITNYFPDLHLDLLQRIWKPDFSQTEIHAKAISCQFDSQISCLQILMMNINQVLGKKENLW